MQDTNLYESARSQSSLSAELVSQTTRPRNLLENKGVIQLDLDDSTHVSRSVIDQSRGDYVICLLLVTRRHYEKN